MEFAKQGKVKKTTIRYIYESDVDLVRIENQTSKGYHIIGYCNLHEVDASWAFAAKNGEELTDMTMMEVAVSDEFARTWIIENVPKWKR